MEQATPKSPRRVSGRGSRVIDRTGQRYGMLVVTEQAETILVNGKYKAHWLCRCDCGNETAVWSWSLGSGYTKSCGCLKLKGNGGNRLAPGRSARNKVLRIYKRNAQDRGHCWQLTDEDFDRLTSQPCFYCGLPPSSVRMERGGPFTYNGIDRMENSAGYIAENCVSCCKTCNRAKRAMPFDEWITWIARLTEHQFFHPDVMPSRLLRDAGKAA